MGLSSVRAGAVVTLAVLFASTATASFAAAPAGEVKAPVPANAASGHYIVLLKDAPLATYDGGVSGIAPTKPGKGNQLDAHSANSQKYVAHLKKEQADFAADAGVTPDTTYQVTLNGFSATLTGDQVASLSVDKNVLGVFPDEIKHPTAAVPSTEFLGLGNRDTGLGGVWDSVGGTAAAGKGVVVGVVDTGIAPENPAFAGTKLGTKAGADPYLVGDTVVFKKSDGNLFRSQRVAAEQWSKQDYSTKLIGAQYFNAGAKASGFSFKSDYASPRDFEGHGSHTSSTAAGNFGTKATVHGIDFGKISGVAPAAKVAMYKACYGGPDPLETTDDICAGSDLLAAIDAAVADGVDVINYSIGGGSASTVLQAEDISFFNAAAAGVFVAVSAGNSGPSASTADHASPWYTTVAASTIPTYEGTVKFPGFNHAGASVSVPFGKEVTGPSVFAGDIGVAGATTPQLCVPGSIDPAKATGHIVVCVRGGNARVEKSDVVKAAGGIGMVLVNDPAGANSLDNDFHAVPTVHMSNVYYAQIVDYVRSGKDLPITLVGDNVSGEVTPTPQIAGFSSRGPMLADGSDVIKPDVSAPGVAIIAATGNAAGKAPTFDFMSGTSMSSPHVAGLGALYLGKSPMASPSEVKSALMTTAYNLVDAKGAPVTDPFTQGAGHVDPTKYFDAGLLYLNGPADWASYLEGALGEDIFNGIGPSDPSDLNIASMGVGSLAGTQTITRTVTATKAGTYTASVDLPGVDAVVSPSTFTIAAGGTQKFTVTFTNKTAKVEAWTTGFLTWKSADRSVRSPIAVFPVTADAPKSVSGSGANGSVNVSVTPGFTGPLPLNVFGLAPQNVIIDGTETTGATTDGTTNVLVEVKAGTELARFAIDSSDDTGSDLDLTVYHLVGDQNSTTYDKSWQSASGSADEAVEIAAPPAGWYVVSADVFSFTSPFTWKATSALVSAGGLGSLTATPNPLNAQQSVPTSYALSWSGLAAGSYLGVVRYGDSQVRTTLTVTVP
ncbi:S8 family serine peptidase [Microbacterium sp. 4R-513]|uniref:S8 family serine peptidase n=1 Tax=Microbacterium sp. 4R-513 TaxID=2567934 RepID=UPI0013E20458|nr:S8 family serine peptidase [Microbacterium sp. 4R-513]QIG38834.1 S8 family serine peptidase [Microbacterium sp. 4R-513]